jgi:ATP-dependent DNA helicase RecG
VAFFDDRVEIESPGGLLPGLTVEMMKAGVSRVRNQVIARVFNEAGLIEQWGSGIPGIYAEAAERGLPEPEVLEFPGRLRFVLRTRHAEFMAGQPPVPSRSEGINGTDHDEATADHVTDQDQPHADQDARVLALVVLQGEPNSRSELFTALGMTAHTYNVQKHLRPLIELGWVEMTIPETPRGRNQRYRLTESGRSQLKVDQPTAAADE